jgi:lysyl-tRNA synthetase class 1
MYPLTKINGIPDEKPKKIPLKLLMFLSQVQNIISIEKLYQKTKSVIDIKNFEEIVTIEEFKYLLKRTENWIEEVKKIIENEKDETVKQNMLQKISIFSIPEKIDSKITNKLSQDQTNGLILLKTFFMENENLDSNLIQTKIFTIAKEELKISPSKLFEAIYQVIFGKKYGPKLGSFLSLIDKSWLLERLSI